MLFEKLTSETMQKVFLSMNPLEVLPKTVIIQQGDEEASKFYVLESGTCEVLLAGNDGTKVVHQYKAGSYFGELALLYDQPRAATVRATAKCKLWVMERGVYNAIYHQEMKEIRANKMKLIQSMPIFKPLSETLQGTLCDVLKLAEVPASKALFYKGDEGDLFYVIKSGTVEITIGERVRSFLFCTFAFTWYARDQLTRRGRRISRRKNPKTLLRARIHRQRALHVSPSLPSFVCTVNTRKIVSSARRACRCLSCVRS